VYAVHEMNPKLQLAVFDRLFGDLIPHTSKYAIVNRQLVEIKNLTDVQVDVSRCERSISENLANIVQIRRPQPPMNPLCSGEQTFEFVRE
jgi:hypothetical protein